MLSDNQKEVLISRVNAEADIPFLGESAESTIIAKMVEKLNTHIEPSLRAICPDPYVNCIKIALTEGLPLEQRREMISTIMCDQLEQPLAEQLNGKLDVSLVPERVEGKLLRLVSRKIIEEFVEWTVAEVDERMDASLEKCRAAEDN